MGRKMLSVLDPKNDLVFHQLFAHKKGKRILISLLTAVLRPKAPITDAHVLNPDVLLEQITDKGIVLDVLVRLGDGTLVDVEMQVKRRPGFAKRIVFYLARTYASQLDRGEDYSELRPASVVVFTNFRETDAKRLHSIYRLLEIHDHQELVGSDLELHLVELPKLAVLDSTSLKKEGALGRWARFLSVKSDQELANVAGEDEMVDEAKGLLQELSADPKMQQLARMRREGEFLHRMELTEARKEGEAIGEKRGKREGEAVGEERGKREGEAVGEERGKREGKAEGKREGKAEGKREMLFILLDRAERDLTAEQQAQLEACHDLATLDQWIEWALAGDFDMIFNTTSES